MVHKDNQDYVALLFYASWCPFSRMFRPIFSILSSLYPSIPHFAIEESTIRPRFVIDRVISVHFLIVIFWRWRITSITFYSILSKYGVHGFPTLFILNSTMRVRYHGSRTPGSLIAFYSDVTGKILPFTQGLYYEIFYMFAILFDTQSYHLLLIVIYEWFKNIYMYYIIDFD